MLVLELKPKGRKGVAVLTAFVHSFIGGSPLRYAFADEDKDDSAFRPIIMRASRTPPRGQLNTQDAGNKVAPLPTGMLS
jgi:hypothetical protein